MLTDADLNAPATSPTSPPVRIAPASRSTGARRIRSRLSARPSLGHDGRGPGGEGRFHSYVVRVVLRPEMLDGLWSSLQGP